MKHRITYLPLDDTTSKSAELVVDDDGIRVPPIPAAKEWFITGEIEELADKSVDLLHKLSRFHVHWASAANFAVTKPLVARPPPGVHLSLSGRNMDNIREVACVLAPMLQADPTACLSLLPVTAVSLGEVRASAFLPVRHGSAFARFVHSLYGDTPIHRMKLQDIETADSIELLVNRDSGTFDIKLFTATTASGGDWPRDTRNVEASLDKVDIGVLRGEHSAKPYHLGMAGQLAEVGHHKTAQATRFSFPSRHHPDAHKYGRYCVSMRRPTGLHPTVDITFSHGSPQTPNPSCQLYTHLTLPSTLFIDRYQFGDSLFMQSNNLVSMDHLQGEADLEAPVWVIPGWGSSALFKLTHGENTQPHVASIPLHLRYLAPTERNSSSPGQREVDVPWPSVFWACPTHVDFDKVRNPFDKTGLGYDALFDSKTVFYHLTPETKTNEDLVARLHAPVLDLGKTENVEFATGLTVSLGFAWICFVLLRAWMGSTQRRVATDMKVR